VDDTAKITAKAQYGDKMRELVDHIEKDGYTKEFSYKDGEGTMSEFSKN